MSRDVELVVRLREGAQRLDEDLRRNPVFPTNEPPLGAFEDGAKRFEICWSIFNGSRRLRLRFFRRGADGWEYIRGADYAIAMTSLPRLGEAIAVALETAGIGERADAHDVSGVRLK